MTARARSWARADCGWVAIFERGWFMSGRFPSRGRWPLVLCRAGPGRAAPCPDPSGILCAGGCFGQARLARPAAGAMGLDNAVLARQVGDVGQRRPDVALDRSPGGIAVAGLQRADDLAPPVVLQRANVDRKSTRLNSSHYCANRMPP